MPHPDPQDDDGEFFCVEMERPSQGAQFGKDHHLSCSVASDVVRDKAVDQTVKHPSLRPLKQPRKVKDKVYEEAERDRPGGLGMIPKHRSRR